MNGEFESLDETEREANIVSLNIGGVVYKTNKKTLIDASDYFSAMLKNFREGEERKEIFIDRDGTLFSHILQFMRTKEFDCGDCSRLNALKQEAEYFMVTDLEEILKKEISQRKRDGEKFKRLEEEVERLRRREGRVNITPTTRNWPYTIGDPFLWNTTYETTTNHMLHNGNIAIGTNTEIYPHTTLTLN